MTNSNEASSHGTDDCPVAGLGSTGSRTLSSAVEILDYMMRSDPEMQRMVDRATAEAMLGQIMYEAREKMRLTRGELAELAGVTADDIEDIEEGNYVGNPFAVFAAIAKALESRVEHTFALRFDADRER